MAVICEDFRIDVAHEQSFKYLQSVQYDQKSRKRRLIITDSNIPVKFSGSEYIVFSMEKDGDNYSNTSILFEDGYPYITFTESMLSRHGDVKCGIKIFDHKDGSVISTFNFMMTISKSLMNYDRLVESSEFNVLNDLILQAIHIKDLYEEFEENKTIIEGFITKINLDIQNYKAEFTQLSSDAQNLINDVEQFLTQSRADEQSRVETEISRVNAETERNNAELERQKQADAFSKAEEIRVQQENERQINTAAAIKSAKDATKNATDQTNTMIQLQDQYTKAEALRQANEETREQNELEREELYGVMEELENTASANEAKRVQQENERQTNTATAITNAEEATKAAWDAVNNIQGAIGIDDESISHTSTWSSEKIDIQMKEWAYRKSIENITIEKTMWNNNEVYIKSDCIKEDSVIDIYFNVDSLNAVAEYDLRYSQGIGYVKITATYTPYLPIVIDNIMIENYKTTIEGTVSQTP